MKIYVAGPIAGIPDGNRSAFNYARDFIMRRGHEPVIPFDIPAWEHEGQCPQGYLVNEGHSTTCWLRADLAALLNCDAIYCMTGWERSRGASLEHRVAVESGLHIFYESRASILVER